MLRMACCALWFTAACTSSAFALPAPGDPHGAACRVWQRELSFGETGSGSLQKRQKRGQVQLRRARK